MKRKHSHSGWRHKKKRLEARKQDFIRAVNCLKSKEVKTSPLDVLFNRRRSLKIKSLCSHDSSIRNHRRQNSSVLPTNTQLLLSQLSRCLSEHNWSAAARCIYYMLEMNGKLLPVIWKALLVVLLNHPDVTAQNLNEFLQMCLGLRTHDEKCQFLAKLLTLPENLNIYSKNCTATAASTDEEFEE